MESKTTKIDIVQSNIDEANSKSLNDPIGSIIIEGELSPGTKIWGKLNNGVEFMGVVCGAKQESEEEHLICLEDFECVLGESPLTDSYLLDLGTFLIQEIMDDDEGQVKPSISPEQ